MTYRIKLIGRVDGQADLRDGMYLVSCDVSTNGLLGVVHATHILDLARTFDSFAEAVEYWKRQSTDVPFRPDGKPNRPLTAWSVEIEQRKEGTNAAAAADQGSQGE